MTLAHWCRGDPVIALGEDDNSGANTRFAPTVRLISCSNPPWFDLGAAGVSCTSPTALRRSSR